jgi:hypothetical protein
MPKFQLDNVNGKILSFPYADNNGFFIDSHTNPFLLLEISANLSSYSVTDGILVKDGVPVAINPPCEDCQTLALLDGDGALTGEQVKSILKLMTQKPGFTRG